MTGSVVSEVTAKLPRIRGSDDKIEYKYYSVTKLPPGRALLGSRFPPRLERWRAGNMLQTSYLSESRPHASLDVDRPAVMGATKSMEIISLIIYQEIGQSNCKIFQLGSGSNQHIQSQLDISTVAIWPCISV